MRPAALTPTTVALAAGGLGVTALVAWYGAAAIGAEVMQAAWALPPILAIHAATQWLSAIAWRWATGGHHPRLLHWFTIRIIRESVNGLLPVAQLGGNVVGIRMLMHRGVSGTAATAGTTIDVTLEALTQLLFTLAGIATLAALHPHGAWAPWVQGGVAAMALGVAGFLVAQRMAGLRMVEWIAVKLVRVFPRLTLDTVRRLFAALAHRQRQYAMLARAAVLHLLTLALGVGETWLALAAMGRPTGLAEALVIESLGVAVRGAAFAVPGGLGVQEAGFVLIGGLLGVPPDQAIALSMTKRLRELAFGVPGLLAWQWLEGRRHMGRRQ
ncbi:MAG: flippase-like domain-containing protein [Acetobacteraceae bacterium]|nr:flippase-like domain-containing protein [Acetobacteraceae bacterium]